MDNKLIVFPGTFDPPTYGHFEIVKEAAGIFPLGLTVVSSENPDKDNKWFSQQERAGLLWSAYRLPRNVSVTTLDEMVKRSVDFRQMVMIRGIRNEDDFLHEQKVMELNFRDFNISKYFYLMTTGKFRDLSSSASRLLAANLDLINLADYVAPLVVTKMLEYVLRAKNVFLVVGRPGSGKSSWLKFVKEFDARAYHIDGDIISRELRPQLEARFSGADLIDLSLNHAEEMLAFLSPLWLRALAEKLRQAPTGSNIYVEAAYGLEANKRLYRHVGGKVIYVGCGDSAVNYARIKERGHKHLLPFVERIPDLNESEYIAFENVLSLTRIDSSGSIDDLRVQAKEFVKTVNQPQEG